MESSAFFFFFLIESLHLEAYFLKVFAYFNGILLKLCQYYNKL